MKKKIITCLISIFIYTLSISPNISANEIEISGVRFETEKNIMGKTLKLNGVSILKKFGFLEVYAVGLYLETPSNNPDEIIYSEQIKYMHTQYLTAKATGEKIKKGFIKLITENNPSEIVKEQRENIDKFSCWLDRDMKPGLSSETIYLPGKGLILIYQGEKKGIIEDKIFAQMYYRYNLGGKADKTIKNGLLGINTIKE